jgi:multidrug efflux pump subunit AcrA (membrane-fusion protein)
MSHRLFITIVQAGILSAAMSLLACAGASKQKPDTASAASTEVGPVSVPVVAAESRDLPLFIQTTGSFAADESSDVGPEVAGQVVATPVKVGAFVKQGEVIARLDARDAGLRLQLAIAAERQATAQLHQAEAKLGLGPGAAFEANAIPEVLAARQNYEAAEAQAKLAEANARRYANLVETGDVSRSVYDQQRTQAETARAQARAAHQQLEVAINTARLNNQAIASAEASLAQARAQVALARKALDDMIVRAPFPGFISDRPAAVGQNVTTSSKVATILRTNPIKLKLMLPELNAGLVRTGMTVSASVAAYADKKFEGKVAAINPAVDVASRAITVEVSFNNPSGQLRPGMFATARISQPGDKAAIFVARPAILTQAGSNSAYVFVIESGIARVRVVQVAEGEGEMARVTSGLSAGEVVAAGNLDRLFDGAEVAAGQPQGSSPKTRGEEATPGR